MTLPENQIICGDCLEVMKDWPDGCVDLVFADPPFNIGKKYTKGDSRDDYREWCKRWIAECWRILKDTGSIYLMTITRHLDWKLPLLAEKGVFINLIKWRNVSACHGKRSFWGEYQPIALYGKTTDYIFNTYAQRRTILAKNIRWGGYSSSPQGQLLDYWDDIPFVYAGSIAHPEAILKEGTNSKLHPCQMPIALPSRAIEFSTNEQALVYEPFAGTGTTCVAAKMLGRRFIGIDISPEYCEIARDRLRAVDTGVPVKEARAGQGALFDDTRRQQ